MARIQTFKCDVCGELTQRIFEFQPRILKKVAVGDKVQSIPVEDATVYEVCSEECMIKVLRKVGRVLLHPESKSVPKKKPKNGEAVTV